MKLSRYEQESILNYNAGEQTATLYTRDKTGSPHRAEGTGKADDD